MGKVMRHMLGTSFNIILFLSSSNHPNLHSFPTRRSSDLATTTSVGRPWATSRAKVGPERKARRSGSDRKSTRLNSSHTVTSYAVFCLKKKKVFEKELRRPI